MQGRDNGGTVVSMLTAGRRGAVDAGREILVVESQSADYLLIERALVQAGHKVLRAEDDEAGLDFVLERSPRIVLVSQGVPGGVKTFLQTVRVMHAGRGWCPAFIVLWPTGADSTELPLLDGVFVQGLQKPVTTADLHPLLMQALESFQVKPGTEEEGASGAESLIDQMTAYEDPGFIRTFVETSLSDIEGFLSQLEGQVFRPEAAKIKEMVHAMHGLALNIGAEEFVRACKTVLARTPEEMSNNHRSTLSGLKKLFIRTRDELEVRYGIR